MKHKLNLILGIALLVLLITGGFQHFYAKSVLINGEKAVDFQALLINGEEMKSADLRGHYILLDFWGSWCAPCRKANPEMVELYNTFHEAKFKDSKGFEIISIGLETNKKSWKKAIKSDNLKWKYHILELAKDSNPLNGEIAQLYGIQQVPTTFLIDPKGIIIGVNLSKRKTENLLTSRLK